MFDKLIGRAPKFLGYDGYKHFAVVAPFLAESDSFLFEVRSDKLKKQPGEICFPGGFIMAGEAPWEAAARELAEELLVPQSNVELVAPLDVLHTPYDAVVYPYLGYLNDYHGTFSTDEVKEVFTVPFAYFLENEPIVFRNEIAVRPGPDFPHAWIGGENYPWSKGTYPVLFYRYEDKVIWGMTARFIHNIVRLYRET